MALLKRQSFVVPLEEIDNAETLFFRLIEMNREKTLKRFSSQYEEVRDKIFTSVTVKGVCESFPLDHIEGDVIHMADGTVLKSHMLANLFADAEEIVFAAVTVEGYDQLAAEETDNLKKLFFDGWGSALAEGAQTWVRSAVKKLLSAENINATFAWSPGQHEVDIKLQRPLFALLKPEDAGISLTSSLMMHPQKSVSSFIGIGHSVEMETLRACDFCSLRETCPASYS